MADFCKAAQPWERLLFALDGLLDLLTCYWWLIDLKWEKGLPIMTTVINTSAELMLTNENDTTQRTINCLGLEEVNIILGLCMPLNGSRADEMPFCTEKSNTLVGHVNIKK